MHKYDVIKADAEDVYRAIANGINFLFVGGYQEELYYEDDVAWDLDSIIKRAQPDYIDDHILLLNGGTIKISYFIGENPNEIEAVGECSCLGEHFHTVLLYDYKEIYDGHKELVDKILEWIRACKQQGIEILDPDHPKADIKIGHDLSFEEKIILISEIALTSGAQTYDMNYCGYTPAFHYIYENNYTPPNPCTFEIYGRHIELLVYWDCGGDGSNYQLTCRETGHYYDLWHNQLNSWHTVALMMMHLAEEPECISIDTTDTNREFDQIKSIVSETMNCFWRERIIELHNRQIRIQLQYDSDKKLINAFVECTTTGKNRRCIIEYHRDKHWNYNFADGPDKLARIVQELAWVDEDVL